MNLITLFAYFQSMPLAASFWQGVGGPCICCGVCGIIPIGVWVVVGMGIWKMFEKAGEPGWAGLVPIYNLMILAKMAGRDPNDGLMLLIPFYGWYYLSYLLFVDVAKRFGKDPGFAVLMLLLPYIAFPILGFGSARYRPLGQKRPAPRRVEDEYEDEE